MNCSKASVALFFKHFPTRGNSDKDFLKFIFEKKMS